MLKNRRVWLSLFLAWVVLYHSVVAFTVIDDLRNATAKPAIPLNFDFRMSAVAGLTTEAFEAGVREGDVLETVDGKPFESMHVLFDAVQKRKPGDFLPAVVRSAKGTEFGVNIRISPLATEPATWPEWLEQFAVAAVLPAICLFLGFWVAFKKPDDPIAWLQLGIMMGFAGFAQDFPIAQLPGQFLMFAWWLVLGSPFGLWATWMILLAFLFPAPTKLDRRFRWLKWLWAAPGILLTSLMTAYELGRAASFSSIAFLPAPMKRVLAMRPDLLTPAIGVLFLILLIGWKSIQSDTTDGRRRARILFLSILIAFAPVSVEAAHAFKRRTDVLAWANLPEFFATIVPLLLFPIALAYVLMIRRAMDVTTTLRYGLQYFLTQRGFGFVQTLVSAAAIICVAVIWAKPAAPLATRLDGSVAALGVIVLLSPLARRLAPWVDRHLFRKDFRSEQSLTALALSLRILMEESAVIHTVTDKIAAALEIQRIAFLLNNEGVLKPACALGFADGSMFSLPESGGVIRHLKIVQKATPLFFDDEKDWIQGVHPVEREPLKTWRAEVAVPICVRDRFCGVLILGSRRDDRPYTSLELQLLDKIAGQTAIAIENSRLARESQAV